MLNVNKKFTVLIIIPVLLCSCMTLSNEASKVTGENQKALNELKETIYSENNNTNDKNDSETDALFADEEEVKEWHVVDPSPSNGIPIDKESKIISPAVFFQAEEIYVNDSNTTSNENENLDKEKSVEIVAEPLSEPDRDILKEYEIFLSELGDDYSIANSVTEDDNYQKSETVIIDYENHDSFETSIESHGKDSDWQKVHVEEDMPNEESQKTGFWSNFKNVIIKGLIFLKDIF